MQRTFGVSTVTLSRGDITTCAVDAIVNAANAELAGGGGVDGAIHRAAGPSLMEQTRRDHPGGCPPGEAVATRAGDLDAKFVFHTVGPVWWGGGQDEAATLRGCVASCLSLAAVHQCRSIAFPAVSCGVYGYPVDLAAGEIVAALRDGLAGRGEPLDVRVVLFDEGTFAQFARVLEDAA
ncbi:MAG: macro domain-containing protein [Planctomycetota bacterium]